MIPAWEVKAVVSAAEVISADTDVLRDVAAESGFDVAGVKSEVTWLLDVASVVGTSEPGFVAKVFVVDSV